MVYRGFTRGGVAGQVLCGHSVTTTPGRRPGQARPGQGASSSTSPDWSRDATRRRPVAAELLTMRPSHLRGPLRLSLPALLLPRRLPLRGRPPPLPLATTPPHDPQPLPRPWP